MSAPSSLSSSSTSVDSAVSFKAYGLNLYHGGAKTFELNSDDNQSIHFAGDYKFKLSGRDWTTTPLARNSTFTSGITNEEAHITDLAMELFHIKNQFDNIATVAGNNTGSFEAINASVVLDRSEIDTLRSNAFASIVEDRLEIDLERSARQQAINSEVNNRATAIGDEAALRADADSQHASYIQTNVTNIGIEVTARGDADTALGQSIVVDRSRMTDLETEDDYINASIVQDRAAAVARATFVTNQHTAIGGSIVIDRALLQAEISNRTNAVSGEATARGDADDDINKSIVADRAVVANIISNTDPTTLDSLAEIVAAFNNSDSSVVGFMNDLRTDVSNIVTTLNNLLEVPALTVTSEFTHTPSTSS